MSAVRRRVLRRPGQVSTVTDLRKATRSARQRERLEKDRKALKRWLTRLKRAAKRSPTCTSGLPAWKQRFVRLISCPRFPPPPAPARSGHSVAGTLRSRVLTQGDLRRETNASFVRIHSGLFYGHLD